MLLWSGAACLLLVAAATLPAPDLVPGTGTRSTPEPGTPIPFPQAPDSAFGTRAPERAASPVDMGPVFDALGILLGIALIAALALFAVRLVRRLARPESPPDIDAAVEEPAVTARDVQEVLRRARDEIALDDDSALAVIRCWESLEALGAAAGLARAASSTATDYVLDMLSTLPLPVDAARRLAVRYDRALFSADTMPPALAAQARADLDLLDAALAAADPAGVRSGA